MLVWAWVLLVTVTGDGVEREWRSYLRWQECVEVIQLITRHHEDQIQARCEYRLIDTTKQGESP